MLEGRIPDPSNTQRIQEQQGAAAIALGVGFTASPDTFLQGGGGVIYYGVSGGSISFRGLINGGGGLRFGAADSTQFSSTLLFNGVPAGVGGDNGYLSWEVFQIVIPF